MTKTKTKTNINRSKNPYPIHLSEEQWCAIEKAKTDLMDLPKYSEIIRAAITMGLMQMSTMEPAELAKTIRGA